MQIDEDLRKCIVEINSIYNKLCNVSSDELRAIIWSIEREIEKSENKDKALDDNLFMVFAVVKETARRFSEGDIIVSANENDRKLVTEKEWDFVNIRDNQAIYSNHWEAGGEKYRWKMVHYDEQLIGGYLLHHKYATEMATGEGKTLVVTLPVFLNALVHKGTHVMTTNAYLSKRDYEITRPLYALYGLSVGCIESYDRTDTRHKEAYDCDITYGSNSTFIFDYLFDHIEINPNRCVCRRRYNFAIIDELDSILVDEASTPHIITNQILGNEESTYKKMDPIVKELLSLGLEYYTSDCYKKTASFTDIGIQWLVSKTGIVDLFCTHRKYQVKDFSSMSQEKQASIIDRFKFQNALLDLLYAYTIYIKDIDYIVEFDKITIIDSNTGRKKPRSRWGHGLHTAIEVKEGVQVEPDRLSNATISIKNYYKLYKKVAGLSGTLQQVKEELREQYGLEFYSVPTHNPVIRKDWPLKIYKTKEEKDRAVVCQIKENITAGRPSLVGCKTILHCEELCKLLNDNHIIHNRLDAKTEEMEAITVSKAGIGDTVTIATNVAGRGTDIKPTREALKNGGLMVIGCDMFDSLRIERQLRGRTGRQGNPGDSVFFVSTDEELLRNLTNDDYHKMQTLANDNFTQEQIRPFFLKAQEIREEQNKKNREYLSRKDDIIAPYRKKYYEQRNDIMFNQLSIERILAEIVNEVHGDIDLIDKQIKSMHDVACAYVRRTFRNDSQNKTIDIPCSDQMHIYTIEVNRKDCYDIEYFKLEVLRQVYLKVSDESWCHLMEHLLEDLDEQEISILEKDYDDMQAEVKSTIYSRLTRSRVVFEERKNLVEPTRKIPIVERPILMSNFPLDAPCPCKSGKKYKDCHGLRLKYHGSRRR